MGRRKEGGKREERKEEGDVEDLGYIRSPHFV